MLSELLLAVALAAPAALVERVVAVVDERPVLLSEVQLVQAVKGLEETAAREAVIDELLMEREAARLPELRPEASAEAAAVASLQARLPTAPASALTRLARRELAILAYVERRFRPLVRVDAATVQAAVDVEWPEPAERPADAEAARRARLEGEQLDALVEEWVKELRAAAAVRRLP